MTRRKASILALLALTAAMQAWPQVSTGSIHVESYRKGPVRVPDYSITVNVTSAKPNFETRIKDAVGNDHFLLSFTPQRVDDQDPRIISWEVRLVDLHRRYLGNVLLATNPAQPPSDRPADHAWALDPSPYAIVPLMTKRIFKVEDFYCTIQVKDRHFLVPDGIWLESMNVIVAFTQTDPSNNQGG